MATEALTDFQTCFSIKLGILIMSLLLTLPRLKCITILTYLARFWLATDNSLVFLTHPISQWSQLHIFYRIIVCNHTFWRNADTHKCIHRNHVATVHTHTQLTNSNIMTTDPIWFKNSKHMENSFKMSLFLYTASFEVAIAVSKTERVKPAKH